MEPANLLDGRAIAEQIHLETAQRIAALKSRGVQPIAGRITPNPGGVGPRTIALPLRNTVRAAELSAA